MSIKPQSCALFLLVLCHSSYAMRKKVKVGMQAEAETPEGYLPICAKEIVRETCAFLRGGLTDKNDGDAWQYLRVDMIKEILSASEDSIVGLWKSLGLPPMPQGDVIKIASEEFKSKLEEYGLKILKNADEAELNIGCEQVCILTRDYIKKNYMLPPASDLACQVRGGEVVCDIDVRPESLEKLHRTGDTKAVHEVDVEQPDMNTFVKKNLNSSIPEPSDYSVIDYVAYEIIEGVAELFRFYPLLDPSREPVASSSLLQLGSGDGEQGSRKIYNHEEAVALGKKAIAYVNRVKVKMESPETIPHLSEWFGASDSRVKTETLRVLNSVVHVLKNVRYEYKGPKCGPSTYAYVYPRGNNDCNAYERQQTNTYCRTDEFGKFIYFLCDVYVNGDDGEKIETLVHEGSHHSYAYTDDVCSERNHVYGVTSTVDCDRAYGRATCVELAKIDKVRALKNADSHCYFVQAIADPAYHEKTRCKSSTRAVTPFTDSQGNCICASHQECYQGSGKYCPCSAGRYCTRAFTSTCTNCKCGAQRMNSTAKKCHSSAESETPDYWGDCKCPDDMKCYKGSSRVPGCGASSILPSSTSPTYFLATCSDCVCKASATSGSPAITPSASCPSFAKSTTPDNDGDCKCPSGTTCDDYGLTCPYSGGRSESYFKSSCSTCTCKAASSSAASSCPASAKWTTPSDAGYCICPDGQRCYDNGGTCASTGVFHKSCSTCTCQAPPTSCPSFAVGTKPDSDGDCRCDIDKKCYNNGVFKCPYSGGSGRDGHSMYFEASCSTCRCLEPGSSAPTHPTPATSATCPSFAEYTTPDSDGDCKCPASTRCDNNGNNCPFSGSSLSLTYFKPSCSTCKCKASSSTPPTTCPPSAKSIAPDNDGDCECPSNKHCDSNGNDCPWRSGTSKRYFKPSCSTCSCKSAGGGGGGGGGSPGGGGGPPRVGQCPSFAKDSTPDSRGDCRCPTGKLCHSHGSVQCFTTTSSLSRYFFASSCTACTCKSPTAGASTVPPQGEEDEDDREDPDNGSLAWQLPVVAMLMSILLSEW